VTTVEVDAGICGYTSSVSVLRTSSSRLQVSLRSDCPMVTSCIAALKSIQLKEALDPKADGWLYRVMFEHIRHAGCIVPAAVAKAIEVEVGAALPRDAHLVFRTDKPA